MESGILPWNLWLDRSIDSIVVRLFQETSGYFNIARLRSVSGPVLPELFFKPSFERYRFKVFELTFYGFKRDRTSATCEATWLIA